MMPVVQLIEIVRSVLPREAVVLLREVPSDRLLAVVEGLGPSGVARLLTAANGDFRTTLIDSLTESQLIDVLRAQSEPEANRLLTALPAQRLNVVVGTMRDERVATLLSALPESRQTALLEAMEPGRRRATLSRKYEHDVADALVRANVEVTFLEQEAGGVMLATGLGWRIAVAARYADDGTIAVRDAEAAAYRWKANAALAITSLRPNDEVLSYCRDARAQGRSIDAVIWSESRHDGPLKRAIVSLFQI